MERIEEKRNKLIEQLSEQYSRNLILLDEYERLIEYGNRIETDKELTLFGKIIEENNIVSNENTDNNIKKLSPSRIYKTVINIIGDIKIRIEEAFQNKIIITVFSLIGDVKIYVPDEIEIIDNMIHLIGDADIKLNTGSKTNKTKKIILQGIQLIGNVKIIKNTDKPHITGLFKKK